MLARVTNLSRGARGLQSPDRGTVLLEPGQSAELDLADHELHRVWAAAGEVAIEALADPEPEAADKPKPKRR